VGIKESCRKDDDGRLKSRNFVRVVKSGASAEKGKGWTKGGHLCMPLRLVTEQMQGDQGWAQKNSVVSCFTYS
jgi:hypothetical protein